MEERIKEIKSQMSPKIYLANEQWQVVEQALRIAYCQGKVDAVQSLKTDLFKPLKY